jgi:hypothetical protein
VKLISICSTFSREHWQKAEIGVALKARALLVEQPVKQALRFQRRVEQFVILDGRGEQLRPRPGVLGCASTKF